LAEALTDTAGPSVVVDSSVAAKWVFPEHGSRAAAELAERWARTEHVVTVPAHFWAEVANIARHKVSPAAGAPGIRAEVARAKLSILAASDLVTAAPKPTLARALELALELGLTVWDAAYVALAESLATEFWTADRDLAGRARRRFPWVRLLGEDDADH